MSGYVVSPEAMKDLQEIGEYIAQDNFDTAINFLKQLENRCQDTATNPGAGRRRDEITPGLRSVTHGSYVIFYRVAPSKAGVEIVRVLHGARDLKRLFE